MTSLVATWGDKSIYPDLLYIKDQVYDSMNYACSAVTIDKESTEYGACSFKLNDLKVCFRSAKITPTKIGQFVTLWKRINDGPIQPYSINDKIDIVVISTRKQNLLGQFIFPCSTLIQKGIFSTKQRDGKRGFRVYPPWDEASNNQAKKTQEWQLNYFLDITKGEEVDFDQAAKLYSMAL